MVVVRRDTIRMQTQIEESNEKKNTHTDWISAEERHYQFMFQ